ncbi:uncharacterized protein K452DRAFT_232819 [Aplosporella prunicola CBS 121167]|uniref:Cytochrome P450 n=1 Tax=Aplosporella prunicola CBS 121167 TaxID=1176127 RepID=A0A6A6B5Q3_9PEZI|nr:uncharacterized protein K452DRAFT_232819 [Aplosporella prunicola CBS 121167]KAF2138958.1 hypothetical protein K452DRAFT_232819 [Aplosporella prunicola CBS 121167]
MPNHPLAASALAALLLYCLATAAYRLYLSPLARFPGPKLAALTRWYEFYHDGLRGGKYTWRIGEMHKRYGPIVRISPWELHVSDTAFIDTLYAPGSQVRDKHAFYTRQFGLPASGFGTASHALHRLRRGALNRFFSRQSVCALEPLLGRCARTLCDQLETYAGTGEVVDLCDAFSCLATDVVSAYAFGRSYGFLENRAFRPNLREGIDGGMKMGATMKMLPWLLPLLRRVPDAWVLWAMPGMAGYMGFQREMRRVVGRIEEEEKRSAGAGGEKKEGEAELQRTIFHEVLRGDLPPEEKKTARLSQEGQAVIGAGTETTAWTLCVILYHVLANCALLENLRTELLTTAPDATSWRALEQLPLLSATVAEGLRLSYGLATRLARVAPVPLRFRSSSGPGSGAETFGDVDVVIPPNTPVGMTAVLVHHDARVFPDSERFWPERWLVATAEQRREMERCLLSFSRGGRQCLGMNLAYAELYITLATVLRRLGARLQLFETDEDDVRVHRDMFLPKPRDGSKGVRVLVV